ncbi:MAG: diguanylate cyclase [Pseudomonadota bacterium]
MSGYILIAEADKQNRLALVAAVGQARYDVHTAETTEELIIALRKPGASVAIVHQSLVPKGDFQKLRRLAAQSSLALIAIGADPVDRVAALAAGADDVIHRGVNGSVLRAKIRSFQRAAETTSALSQREETIRGLGLAEPAMRFAQPGDVAIVSHDGESCAALAKGIAGHSPHRLHQRAMSEALHITGPKAPEAYIIEAPMAHPGDALSLLTELRARPETRNAGILLLHDTHDAETATMALDLGASDIASVDASPEELAIRVDRQITQLRQNERLRISVEEGLRLAVRDPLTGVYNRRYAEAHIKRVTRERPRCGYCVILVDVDRFKSINDCFGHAAADRVLTAISSRLTENVREMDMVARIGGDEFLIFIPDPDPAAAVTAAERLCEIIREMPIDLGDGNKPVSVTASLGLAMARPGGAFDLALDHADQALYAAKEKGRDTVSVSPVCTVG